MHIIKDNQVILQGNRDGTDGLWKINLKPLQINYIVKKDKSKTELAQYLHACAFSPAISTFQECINRGNFVTWPGIETLNFKKLLQNPEATLLGHLDQERKNLQSTKEALIQNDIFPTKSDDKTNEFYYCIYKLGTGINYTDLTGRFPVQSSRGVNYIFVAYNYDHNAILFQPLKNREADSIVKAWDTNNNRVKIHGEKPKHYVLDNEASKLLMDTMTNQNITFELVPPHQHRRNAAERAIRTFKNHLLAGLATCHPDFPIREWDRLLSQCELTLNLLRNSRINPKLSAWASLFGVHDFNKVPLLPPGTKVIVHEKPAKRGSWSFHGVHGWYTGPSFMHYRCLRCYIPKTHKERITDTIEIVPHLIPIPQASIESVLRTTANKLVTYLHSMPKLFKPPTHSTQKALKDIATLLHRDLKEKPESFITTKHLVSTTEGDNTKKVKTKKAISEGEKVKENEREASRDINKNLTFIPNKFTKRFSENNSASPTPTIIHPLQKTITTKASPSMKKFPSIRHPMSLRNRKPHYQLQSYKTRATQYLAAQSVKGLHTSHINHIYTDKGVRLRIDKLLNEDKHTWERSLSNELGRLTQGIGNIQGNDAMDFIKHTMVPKHKKVAYANMVCDIRPTKAEKYRVRLTIGGDILEYLGDASSPAASLMETKLMLNSVISDAHRGAKFLSIDIKDYFLQSFLSEPEYLRIHSKYFFEDIKKRYNIEHLIAPDGYVYCKVKRGLYGLKQAARLARDQLVNHLNKYGYSPCAQAPNIWRHATRKTKFILCVDDFGVKYFNNEDAEHLVRALKDAYEITIDRSGTKFCGMNISWNYERGYVDVNMPQYVQKMLDKLQHPPPKRPQHAPHQWIIKQYGAHSQQTPPPDNTPTLSSTEKTKIQQIVGGSLYYGRAIDGTILPAINELSMQQANPTEGTQAKATMLLDYLHSHPKATIRYLSSAMQLHVQSDAAYLVCPGAKSRVAGFFYLGKVTAPQYPKDTINAATHIDCRTLKHVVSSAAEAETAGIFQNCCTALDLRNMLTALGHPQKPIPVITDNSTAVSFSEDKLKAKRSKSWDMRLHWLKDRVRQQQFRITWEKGKTNLADYFTKHFPPSYHQHIRSKYILKGH